MPLLIFLLLAALLIWLIVRESQALTLRSPVSTRTVLLLIVLLFIVFLILTPHAYLR